MIRSPVKRPMVIATVKATNPHPTVSAGCSDVGQIDRTPPSGNVLDHDGENDEEPEAPDDRLMENAGRG